MFKCLSKCCDRAMKRVSASPRFKLFVPSLGLGNTSSPKLAICMTRPPRLHTCLVGGSQNGRHPFSYRIMEWTLTEASWNREHAWRHTGPSPLALSAVLCLLCLVLRALHLVKERCLQPEIYIIALSQGSASQGWPLKVKHFSIHIKIKRRRTENNSCPGGTLWQDLPGQL